VDIGTVSISCCDMWCVVVCRFIKHRYVMDRSLLKKKIIFILFLFKLDRRSFHWVYDPDLPWL